MPKISASLRDTEDKRATRRCGGCGTSRLKKNSISIDGDGEAVEDCRKLSPFGAAQGIGSTADAFFAGVSEDAEPDLAICDCKVIPVCRMILLAKDSSF